MNRDKLAELYKAYELEASDVFKHQHYLIITRSGIDKIQAKAGIKIKYEVVNCENNCFYLLKIHNNNYIHELKEYL